MIKRDYMCRLCGQVRRALAQYVPGGPPIPSCCQQEMVVLYYEQAIASARMTDKVRAEWYSRGGKYEERAGERQWRAVG